MLPVTGYLFPHQEQRCVVPGPQNAPCLAHDFFVGRVGNMSGTGPLYHFEAELPQGLEDADRILDAVLRGACSVNLCFSVDSAVQRWESRYDEVIAFSPTVLVIQQQAAFPGALCWVEEDGEITYPCFPEVQDVPLAFYDEVLDPETPNDNRDVLSFQAARRIRQVEDCMEGPVEGLSASLRFITSKPGEVELMISKGGVLIGLIRLDGRGVEELADAVDEYFDRYPETANDDEADDGPGAAA